MSCILRARLSRGLDIDNHGNVIALDTSQGAIYDYKGCNPACTVVGGAF